MNADVGWHRMTALRPREGTDLPKAVQNLMELPCTENAPRRIACMLHFYVVGDTTPVRRSTGPVPLLRESTALPSAVID
jgi:hypothetical protein